jgi:transposase
MTFTGVQEMITRKKYSKEFKLDAISLVLDQRYTRIEAARSLDINANMLGRWIKEHQGDGNGQAFRGNGKLAPEQEAIRKLKAQVKQLQLEKCILKETTVFFAKETKQNTRLLPQRRRPSESA